MIGLDWRGMATYGISEAKGKLTMLVTAATRREEVLLTRRGKVVARITGVSKPKKRVLGFHPIKFRENLVEPTRSEIVDEFYR